MSSSFSLAQRQSTAELQMCDTLENWTKWCERTANTSSQLRCPPWRSGEDVAKQKALEDKKNRERSQMQRILAQGLYKTKIARELAHLPSSLDSETVQRSRRDALEVVEKRTRRIKKALSDAARQRSDIQGCINKLQAVKDAAAKAELEEYVASRSSFFFGLKQMLTVDKVNNFREEELPYRDKKARKLSRQLGVSIPDAEVIASHFEKFASGDGSVVSKADFPKLIESLCGRDAFSEAQIRDSFRSMDTDGDGYICFSEYVIWHLDSVGAPRLSMALRN